MRRVCTAEEVGKRPSGSRLLRFFPLCRTVSLRPAARRSLKKDFALREGGRWSHGRAEFRNFTSPRGGGGGGGGGRRETVSRTVREGMKGKSVCIVRVSFTRRLAERGRVRAGKVAKGKLACSGQTDRARQQPVQRVPTLFRDTVFSCRE